MQYKHTQNGVLIKWIMGVTIAICLFIAGSNGWVSPVSFSLYGVVLVMLVLVWFFGSLTVEVTDEELVHYFGPKFWKKTYFSHDIESVEIVRNSWIYGWGIRLTPHGWLYNVSGLDAVQIQLRSGRTFRIGTDDPAGLVSALQPT